MKEYLFIVGYSCDPKKYITRVYADSYELAVDFFMEVNGLDKQKYRGVVSTVIELTSMSYKRTK
ncbi:MAG TPA: hypothetical protein VI815_02465 [Candidatus Nanoarchaeia archaeon]|nr:hypothetical protein [Candidatus Nanoarchaeia archaeon]